MPKVRTLYLATLRVILLAILQQRDALNFLKFPYQACLIKETRKNFLPLLSSMWNQFFSFINHLYLRDTFPPSPELIIAIHQDFHRISKLAFTITIFFIFKPDINLLHAMYARSRHGLHSRTCTSSRGILLSLDTITSNWPDMPRAWTFLSLHSSNLETLIAIIHFNYSLGDPSITPNHQDDLDHSLQSRTSNKASSYAQCDMFPSYDVMY